MQEASLKTLLAKLGIKVEGSNRQRHTGKVWLNFRCPLAPFSLKHEYKTDRNPSAGAVTDQKGHASRWHCLSCKAHGSLYDLALMLGSFYPDNGIDYQAIAQEIAQVEETGLGALRLGQELEDLDPLPEPLIEEAYDGLWPAAWAVPEAREYLESRGIGLVTSEWLGLVFDPERRRILFPVRDRQGALFGFSGRAIDPDRKPRILDYEGLPKRHLILGSHLWKPELPTLIVEGLFGFAHLFEVHADDICNPGAIMGSVLTPEKATILKTTGQPVYLLMDNDEAGDVCLFGPLDDRSPSGRDESRSAIAMLRNDCSVFVPEWPDGTLDPDQLTYDEIRYMLDTTLPFGVEAI